MYAYSRKLADLEELRIKYLQDPWSKRIKRFESIHIHQRYCERMHLGNTNAGR